jgi:hypothetical protein
MAKNIFIGVLIILCGILLLSLFNKDNTSSDSPVIAKITKNKLSHLEIIKSANVHGLSLETPIQNIDAILAKEPFKCRTNERENKTIDGKVSQEKFWTCSHTNLQNASLRIHVIDGVIQSIARLGPSTKQSVEKAMAQLDILKMKMENLKGFTMSQSESSTTFVIHHRREDNKQASMSYRMQILPVRDPANPPPHEGTLNVTLVR